MYCDIITSIKTYFRCCVNRENDAAGILKKNDSDATDGERSPATFDDLTASTSSSNSSSSWSLSSSSGECDHNHHNQDFSQRIQIHNHKLFHPFLYHTGGTATIP
jgi:hypothetical protein